MSLTQSPKIATYGLLFGFDTANSKKSLKGCPTTNICDNNTFYSNWTNSGAGVWNGDDQDMPRLFQNLPILSLVVTTAGNMHISHAHASISAGLTYTVSTHVYIPSSAGTLDGSVPYIRTDPANTSRGTLAYNGNTNWNTWPKDRWIRISQTFTNSANDTGLYISCYLNNLNNKIYFTGPQVENLSIMSGFTGGSGISRSVSEAILDQVGSHTITATNMNSTSYANTSYIALDGNNQYLYTDGNSYWNAFSPDGTNGNSQMSIELVFSSSDGSGLIISRPWNGSGQYNYTIGPTYFGLHSASSGTSLSYSNICTGAITHMVWWMNSTQYGVYKNGQVYVAATNHGLTGNGGSAGTGAFGTLFGSLYPYGEGWGGNTGFSIAGNYYLGRIYNRTLTSAEVQQNFNALRGRYGL